MKNKSKLISLSIFKVAGAFILCCMITVLTNAFAPNLTNELAIGQLQNDDISWSILQTWYTIQHASSVIKVAIGAVCGFSVGSDIYKYFKSKGEN